jgi:hypothetical protein
MDSTSTRSRKTPMLMRSQTPTHGVGRFAAIRGPFGLKKPSILVKINKTAFCSIQAFS